MQHAVPRRKTVNWTGWQTKGDKLYTPNGEFVTQGDILALPYLRMALRQAQRELKQLKPPPEPREPVQLTLPHVPPIWRVKATWPTTSETSSANAGGELQLFPATGCDHPETIVAKPLWAQFPMKAPKGVRPLEDINREFSRKNCCTRGK